MESAITASVEADDSYSNAGHTVGDSRLALTTGFIGGLTTYSSFAYETTRLVQEGALGTAFLNLGFTTVACFAAVLLGLAVAQRLTGV